MMEYFQNKFNNDLKKTWTRWWSHNRKKTDKYTVWEALTATLKFQNEVTRETQSPL